MQKNADTVADTVQGLDWLDNEQKVHEKMHARLPRPHGLPGAVVPLGVGPRRTGHLPRPHTRPQPSIDHPSHRRPVRHHTELPSRPMSTGLA